ncbi:MAG: CbiX/SirB N-terminal domain-containing protein [Deltaproteobacteria bacterium]|nr:CbiX/SirB N-terminal domain-containing protein [Deltaproteobacteria bacterium]
MPFATTFLAHGSKKESANEFFRQLVAEITNDDSVNVCFLEAGSPNLQDALEFHVKNNAKQIRIIPLFLAPGRHVTEDIPRMIQELRERFEGVELKLETFMGDRKDFKKLLKSLII